MSDHKECARCGDRTPVIDNIEDTKTYYGFQVKTETETIVRKSVRLIIWSIYGPFSKRAKRGGSPVVKADEEQPLCAECGGLLIGRFMQGRNVPAMPGKEE